MVATHTVGAEVPNTQAEGKALATLAAQFALKGFVLDVQRRDGSPFFTVSRWGQCRCFSHPNDVQAFARQVGAA